MGLQARNYEAISLTGTMTSNVLGNGITANTVHQIYCLSGGSITINPMGGGSFIWTANTNTYIDVVAKQTVVNTGLFIGFRDRYDGGGGGLY